MGCSGGYLSKNIGRDSPLDAAFLLRPPTQKQTNSFLISDLAYMYMYTGWVKNLEILVQAFRQGYY